MKARALPLLSALLVAILPGGLQAQPAEPAGPSAQGPEPRFERVVSSDNKATREEKTLFGPDTPRIFVLYRIMDAPKGTRIRALWFAQKLEGFTENARLADLSAQTGEGNRFMGSFSCNRPPHGWWLGTYRVELSINDKVTRSVVFRVEAGVP